MPEPIERQLDASDNAEPAERDEGGMPRALVTGAAIVGLVVAGGLIETGHADLALDGLSAAADGVVTLMRGAVAVNG